MLVAVATLMVRRRCSSSAASKTSSVACDCQSTPVPGFLAANQTHPCQFRLSIELGVNVPCIYICVDQRYDSRTARNVNGPDLWLIAASTLSAICMACFTFVRFGPSKTIPATKL